MAHDMGAMPRRKKPIFYGLLLLLSSHPALGKNRKKKAYDRTWKKRRKGCELEQCAHLVAMENDNCVNECTSPTCYGTVFGAEPLEPGEVDRRREREFAGCCRNEEKAAAHAAKTKRRSEAQARRHAAPASARRRLLSALTVSDRRNKFGIGVYDLPPASSVAVQLPWARNLTGAGGSVLLYFTLSFAQSGNASSCVNECVPSPDDLAAVHQAYSLGLRPIVRLGQWPRTIRNFSDDVAHRQYTALARAYRSFAAALPLPPDGRTPLDVVVLNEPNGCSEWACKDNSPHPLTRSAMAAEAATCLRDLLAALRRLPRLRLAAAPTAYAAPATCACDGSPNPEVDFTKESDLDFMRAMVAAVPDLYSGVDAFHSHAYAFASLPMTDARGRNGTVHYRDQLPITGFPDLPVLITECGWHGTNETFKAQNFVAAFTEEWLPDSRVEAVMPFLLTAANGSAYDARGRVWVQPWANGHLHYTEMYRATRELRCIRGVGGAC